MENSFVLKTSCGKIFAEIKNVRRTDTLLSVRERVHVTNRQNFNFLLFGTPLKPKQESKTLVQDCSVVKGLNGDAEITIRVHSPTQASRLFCQTQPKVVSNADCPTVDKSALEKRAFGNLSTPEKKITETAQIRGLYQG
jgi:hypothetical protein